MPKEYKKVKIKRHNGELEKYDDINNGKY